MYNNIFYFNKINKIGGTEQFLIEIAKKYYDLDITIFYDEIDYERRKELSKYVRVKKRVIGEKIKCIKAFYNFSIGMIEDVEAKEHIFISHAIYQEIGEIPPITHPKITKIIGVSQYACDMINKLAEELGVKIKAEKCYNPYTPETVKKPKIILTACRLNDKVKGGERTTRLIEALDKYCKENNENYLFLIFSNYCRLKTNSPNVVIKPPTTNILPFMSIADYVAQLSNNMETFCYTTNQALSLGVPIITTPLSIIEELPIDDNMRIELKYDCSNVDEVAREIFTKKVKRFSYIPPEDNWKKILAPGKSTYKQEKRVLIHSRVIEDFTLNDFDELEDIQRADRFKTKEGHLYIGDTFYCDETMFEYLTIIPNGKPLIERI